MNKKLKTYKTFEQLEIDEFKAEIHKVLEGLVKQKIQVSMLNDTIQHVCSSIEKTLPPELEEFMSALEKYDHDISSNVSDIINVMIDGYSNIKDLIEEVESCINEIEKFLKTKQSK